MDAGGYFVKIQSQGYMEVDSASQGFIAGINSATGGTVSTVMQYAAQIRYVQDIQCERPVHCHYHKAAVS